MSGAQKKAASFHQLRWISVVGGFLDGLMIDFAPGLNCIIGGRGTGKTTILEFVRYALDAMPDDNQACKRIEALVDRNLDFGRIELGIQTKEGLSYIISRAVGENLIVMTDDRKPTDITLKAGSFFKADIFSQNEVESIADQSLSQLDLIDSFEAEQIGELSGKLRELGVDLAGNASLIGPLQDRIAALEEEIKALPGVEEKLKGFAAAAGGDADAINQAHGRKALRDREKRAMDGMSQFLIDYSSTIGDLLGRMEREARLQFTKELIGGPNKTLLTEVGKSLVDCGREVDATLKKVQERIKLEQERIATQNTKLTSAHAEQELAFRTLIEKHQAAMGQATERTKLEKQHNDLQAKKRELEDAQAKLKKMESDRESLLKKLTELRHKRFQVRKKVADRINEALSPNIRVTILQDGNPQGYLSLVEEALRGSKMKYSSVAQKIVNAMWPADLASLVRARNNQGLAEKAELNPDQAEKALAALSVSGRLFELETVELIDQPKIELKDGENYKGSQSLSTGQKCTTILPILLMESEKPLLIDQPEDNLDNRFIAETVVRNLRSVKSRRQLIFVTHSPNIPVLGDAEGMFVMESDGTSARLQKSGTVDGCRDEIVMMLEGGEEAFRQRKTRYKI